MPTTVQTLKEVCRRLNTAGVQYVVIGGFAIIFHGLERLTQDIDLLVDPSRENIRKIKESLQDLLPEACGEIREEYVEGVNIPIADLESMLKLKKTLRPKDSQDYIFLLGKKDFCERQQEKRQPRKSKKWWQIWK